ncbi:hypothetical protein D9O29_08640 [Pantoea vagans]|uniref:Transposase n=1 Tax=Pantoea vagans TaxID=470934 RepID=A0ABY3LH67_9GAMM|nr:hypothetical protein D9O29_08640 [Pantoea vagans]
MASKYCVNPIKPPTKAVFLMHTRLKFYHEESMKKPWDRTQLIRGRNENSLQAQNMPLLQLLGA